MGGTRTFLLWGDSETIVSVPRYCLMRRRSMCDRQLQSSLTTDFIDRFASLHLHPDAKKWDPAPITQRQVQGTIAELALRDLVMVLAGLGLSLCSLFLSVSLLSWVHLSVSGRFVGRCFLIGCLQVKLLPLELSFPHLFPVITSSS